MEEMPASFQTEKGARQKITFKCFLIAEFMNKIKKQCKEEWMGQK